VTEATEKAMQNYTPKLAKNKTVQPQHSITAAVSQQKPEMHKELPNQKEKNL